MVDVSFLDGFYTQNAKTYVKYLQDSGPIEPSFSEYIDSEILEAHCEACKLRRTKRRQARKFKPRTFKREA